MSFSRFSHSSGLNPGYADKIKKFPMLSVQEEFQLASDYKKQGNQKSLEKLLNSHLRLVAKIASGYRGYGLPLTDLISEGNLGMLQALKHFEPEKGFRFSTYAMWWIKANIKDYILRTWSLVRIGTTAAEKKLFFKLRSSQTQANSNDSSQEMAESLGVREKDYIQMKQRLSGHDSSLNAPLSQEEGASEWIDWVMDDNATPETKVLEENESKKRKDDLDQALKILSPREYQVFFSRRLQEPTLTLEELS